MTQDIQVRMARQEAMNSIKQAATKMVWVTFQKEGIHAYPAAGTDSNLHEVKFLANPHRHMFHFKIWIQVFHEDRDIEFILFKRWCESLYSQGTLELDYKSCEMLSDDLYLTIAEKYPNRDVWIEISEDGENGSYTQYDCKE